MADAADTTVDGRYRRDSEDPRAQQADSFDAVHPTGSRTVLAAAPLASSRPPTSPSSPAMAPQEGASARVLHPSHLQDLTMGDILMLSTALPLPPAPRVDRRDGLDTAHPSSSMEGHPGLLLDGLPNPPPSSPEAYTKTPTPPNPSSKMHSLLTSSRNVLPPPPPPNAAPSCLPPAPLRPRMATSKGTLARSASVPSHAPSTVSPLLHNSPARSSAASAMPIPAGPSGAKPVPPASSSAPHTAAPLTPIDGRCKRYTETQTDYKPGGYARIKEGDRLNRDRYEVVKKLGVGHFSVVWLAWDREEGGYVAIKIVRSSRRYARAARHEEKLLTVLQGPRDERKDYIVSFLNSFEERAWEGLEHHVCLVFELMGMSLTDVLRKNDFDGLPIKTVKLITKQVLTGLFYLHSQGIAHTDIKPDNILLYHSPRQMSKMLRIQLEADEAEKEKQAKEEALNPKPEPINWLAYKPKIPGLNPQQIREIQLARIRAEQRKWVITPSFPLESPIPFVNGKKIVKEFVLANKHLYKKYPVAKSSTAITSPASSDQSNRSSFEHDRLSATHPVVVEDTITSNGGAEKEGISNQTTPTKEIPSSDPSSQSSASPQGKHADTTNTTVSSQTAPSSTQSSKSPVSSLGQLRLAKQTFAKDVPSYMQAGRMLERLSSSNFLNRHQQADELNVGSDLLPRSDAFALKHTTMDNNGSNGNGESDFDKLLRQPMEYDMINPRMGGHTTPMFIQKSPSDSGASEIFSPPSTTATRYSAGTASGAGSATDSPASLVSTPIGSSPETNMARKFPLPIFPHPGAIYSWAVPVPQARALDRTGSTGSLFGSASFPSFSSADGVGEQYYNPASILTGRPGLSRAKSTYELEDEQAMLSLPASPPSHPSSFISIASMSPEVSMRKGSLLSPGLARSGSDASIIGGGFDFSITEEAIAPLSTSTLLDYGGSRIKHEDGNITLINRQKDMLGDASVSQGFGFNVKGPFPPYKDAPLPPSQALAIPKAGLQATDSVSPLVSASPPKSMTLSSKSSASDASSQSSPIQMGSIELVHPPYQPKITKLDSPARVKSDPLLNVHVKLSDLGNAIYYNELKRKGALPENVCTRQYRPPENIIQADYDLGVDVWALGCVIYEMITGEVLFNPVQEKYRYTKEDDLLGQQMELLGPFSPEFALSGRKSLDFFNRHGSILRVRLSPWLLLDVMVKKYYMPRAKALKFCDFLLRMLEPDPSKRATVDDLLLDPWANEIEEDDDMVLYRERKKQPATSSTNA